MATPVRSGAAAAATSRARAATTTASGLSFIGAKELKALTCGQRLTFERWAKEHNWWAFHSNRTYDPWAFPTDDPSAFGKMYTVDDPAAQRELWLDDEFTQAVTRNAELLMLSWGWDLHSQKPVDEPETEQGQSWQDWPVRLFKCGRALQLFHLEREHESVKEYAWWLKKLGVNLLYTSSTTRRCENVVEHWEKLEQLSQVKRESSE
eukprot:TRINITY_DN17713_c0_g1_i1.p1 TRINITY_DN17713_c0_g1~~TRINITY_DN17713_c0_g1_i1.p1  ORF type:complete len:216 (+),score=52.60 TRINITY_DN17713_c0_g1_i1:30-650(+)